MTEPSEVSFTPSTSLIYKSCTLLKPEGEVGTLMFVSRPRDTSNRLMSCSIPGLQVLVKLVPRSYSREVHEHMAKNKLAVWLCRGGRCTKCIGHGVPWPIHLANTIPTFQAWKGTRGWSLSIASLFVAFLRYSTTEIMFTVIFEPTTHHDSNRCEKPVDLYIHQTWAAEKMCTDVRIAYCVVPFFWSKPVFGYLSYSS